MIKKMMILCVAAIAAMGVWAATYDGERFAYAQFVHVEYSTDSLELYFPDEENWDGRNCFDQYMDVNGEKLPALTEWYEILLPIRKQSSSEAVTPVIVNGTTRSGAVSAKVYTDAQVYSIFKKSTHWWMEKDGINKFWPDGIVDDKRVWIWLTMSPGAEKVKSKCDVSKRPAAGVYSSLTMSEFAKQYGVDFTGVYDFNVSTWFHVGIKETGEIFPTRFYVFDINEQALIDFRKAEDAIIEASGDDDLGEAIVCPAAWYVSPKSAGALEVVVQSADIRKGLVAGGGVYRPGENVTLKAIANKGYVFSHWEGPLDDATDPRSPSVSYVVGDENVQFTAYFVPVADDAAAISFEMADEYAAGAAIAPVAIDVSKCTSLPKVTVKGLPSGLKFTAKDVYKKGSKTEVEYPANTIYGTPTKSGVYTVVATVTTAGKKTASASQTIIVRKPNEKVVVPVAASEGGEVKGGGVYASGKKVTLKATAKKGFVFAGWYEDEEFATPCDSAVADYRNPSYAYTMGGSDKMFYARFEPAANDMGLDLAVDGSAVPTTFTVSESTQLALDVESLSLPKISVKGLPAGMKFTAKAIYRKGSKTEVETPANTIYGAPTKPGMYKVSVSISNTSVKKAVVKEFTIEVPNLTAADHLFRNDGEFYISNDPGEMYSMYVGVQEFDLPKIRLNLSGTLKVSGLPAGLKYVPGTGSIEGIATKDGIYTVYLTVGKQVSTFTIEVKPLPDWVVGTFEGYDCDNLDKYSDNADAWKKVFAISGNGMMSVKEFGAEGNKIAQYADKYQLTRVDGDMFVMESRRDEGDGEWISLNVTICRHKRNGVDIGIIEGISSGGDDDGYWEGKVFAVQNIWSKDSEFNFLPEIRHGTEMFIDMTGWKQWDGDYDGEFPGWYGLYVEGCTLNLKFGKNGAVTAAFYEAGSTKATGTASATLMPYDCVGNTVKALLTIAIAPKGRHSICVALYLDIDVLRGVVYGDNMTVTDYLMEAN